MKVRLPVMVQDLMTAERKGFDPVAYHVFPDENFEEDFFLDGPISKRVAILDFKADNSALRPGALFIPPDSSNKYGTYQVDKNDEVKIQDNHNFIQVSVFTKILLTMYMFEENDVLGRKLRWAFNGSQLLVIPQAGNQYNAFYERDSHSLQFFWHRDAQTSEIIHASLSSDVIAHETAHAIFDGIAPDLYDAITPQSLALHESIADLTAGIIAFRSPQLRKLVLKQTSGSIEGSNAFNRLAEEFGEGNSYFRCLRSLKNSKTLDPEAPEGDRVHRHRPHSLCQVLSGALYSVMIKMHKYQIENISVKENVSPYSASGKALYVASEQFKRMIFRALDYLPPGEVSFADYGRAILAADLAAFPLSDREREWIILEFIKRRIVPDRDALDVTRQYDASCLRDIELTELVNDDWLAYRLVEENRELFGMPVNIPFDVRSRLDVTKKNYRDGNRQDIRECIFKVSWQQYEDNPLGPRFPDKRRIVVGTTMAIDWEKKEIRALLTSGHAGNREADEQAEDRTGVLRWLVEEDLLTRQSRNFAPNDSQPKNSVRYHTTKNVMKTHGMGMLLHLIGNE